MNITKLANIKIFKNKFLSYKKYPMIRLCNVQESSKQCVATAMNSLF